MAKHGKTWQNMAKHGKIGQSTPIMQNAIRTCYQTHLVLIDDNNTISK